MKRSMKASELMHKLLIENEMDSFSVIEARDAFLSITEDHIDPIEARKKVYRQILRFQKNEWLRSEGTGRNKKYFQSEAFKQQFRCKAASNELTVEPGQLISNFLILMEERNEYEGELEITLNEIDECRSLISRFPDLEGKLTLFLQESKERSALLLGKLNVLTHVINLLSKETS